MYHFIIELIYSLKCIISYLIKIMLIYSLLFKNDFSMERPPRPHFLTDDSESVEQPFQRVGNPRFLRPF